MSGIAFSKDFFKPAEVKLSDILKSVKKTLPEDGFFICDEIRKSHTPGTDDQKDHLRAWIGRQLGTGYASYGGWLAHNYPTIHSRYKSLNNEGKASARLPWVDWMIAELEKTGE